MPTILELGQKVKTKYPGSYDDLSDAEVGALVKTKFPGSYDDFTNVSLSEAGETSISKSLLDFGKGFLKAGAESVVDVLALPTPSSMIKSGISKVTGGKVNFPQEPMQAGAREIQKSGVLKRKEGGEKYGGYTERVAEVIGVNPLTAGAKLLERGAIKLYLKALKPSTLLSVAEKEALAKTGIEERVYLTRGGVEKVANRIDDFEAQLGDAISNAKEQGLKIKTAGVTTYINEARKFFTDLADTNMSKKALSYFDSLQKNFVKKYGEEIPIEVAQSIKVNTGRLLRDAYGELSSFQKEGQKQVVRFLKDEIVDAAPVIKDINTRLKKLYQFDKSLGKAASRVSNLNLLGLGAKVAIPAAFGGGKTAAAISAVLSFIDSPTVKTFGAIRLDSLEKVLSKLKTSSGQAAGVGIGIPLNTFLREVISEYTNQK